MDKIKMSEAAYIIAGDLANVHRAQDALRDIPQENSDEYISKEDYKTVMSILSRWSDVIFKKIEVI